MSSSAPGAVVVGTNFGVLTHVRALRGAGFEVRALVGRDPAKTKQRADAFDIPVGTTSLDEALALSGVDVVAVATPPGTHAEITLAAIAAGKHVVCEKPFMVDADEGQRVVDAAEAAGIIHLMGNEFRFATGQAHSTRAVREGAIGEPRLATFIFQMPLLADPTSEVPDWWSDADQSGGWLGAYASHVIDHMRTMLGEITEVSAMLTTVGNSTWTADDTYHINFRTERGVEGVLQSSAATYGPFVMVSRVVGTAGTLWIEGDAVHVADADGERQLETPDDLVLDAPIPPPAELMVTTYDFLHCTGLELAPYTKLYVELASRMAGAPPSSDPAASTFRDGLATQRILDAIRRSGQEKQWVRVGA